MGVPELGTRGGVMGRAPALALALVVILVALVFGGVPGFEDT